MQETPNDNLQQETYEEQAQKTESLDSIEDEETKKKRIESTANELASLFSYIICSSILGSGVYWERPDDEEGETGKKQIKTREDYTEEEYKKMQIAAIILIIVIYGSIAFFRFLWDKLFELNIYLV